MRYNITTPNGPHYMTHTQKRALRAFLLELARLIAGVLLMAAAMVSIPFLFAVL